METWRAIPDWPYEVNRAGVIRRTRASTSGRRGQILKPVINKSRGPYAYVTLHHEGRRKICRVCVLVCEAFHGPRPDGYEVSHKNGKPSDDRSSNLFWQTHAANMDEKKAHGTWGVKLSESQALDIKVDVRANRVIADEYDTSTNTVRAIKAGRSWAHLP